ncbi:MAG TPA: hypothetical protein VJR29_11330 [bacterium]|nr:hypothetical protein [bacterium]
MKTLKLFLLSVLCGHPLSFLADWVRIRLAKSMVRYSEGKDLFFLTDDYDPRWAEHLERLEFDESEDDFHARVIH